MNIKLLTVAMFIAGCEAATDGEHLHVHYELPEWEHLNETVVKTSGDTSTGFSNYDFEGGELWPPSFTV